MAREFIDGFESGSCDLWTVSSSAGTIVNAATYGLDGSYAYRADASSAIYVNVTARDEYYGAFRHVSPSPGKQFGIRLMNGSTVLGTVANMMTVQPIEAFRGDYNGTLVGSGTTNLGDNTVRLIEFYYKPKTDSTGRFVIKVNGTIEVDFTGQTSNNALQINRIGIVGIENSLAYLDNIIIDSSEYPGSTYIQAIVPTGAGNATQYSPSTGSNYTCVDEIPYSDTDYITTNAPNNVDTYSSSNLTGNIGSIKCVQVQARACYEGATSTPNIDLVVRAEGTDYPSADKTVPSSYRSVNAIWGTNPATSSAWTESGVNGIEIGVKAKA